MINILLSNRLADRKMTQKDLVEKTGIRPATICAMFNDTARFISLENLELICEVLECDVCDILTREAPRIAQAEKVARHLAATRDMDFMKMMNDTARKLAKTQS